jgi:hypothetical protein
LTKIQSVGANRRSFMSKIALVLRQIMFATATLFYTVTTAYTQTMWEKNVCLGHVWIHNLANITSKSDSELDPLSCWFDPSSNVGRRVLGVCNEVGGDSKHGCYVKGTFRVNATTKVRELTGVVDVQKTEGECANVTCEWTLAR